MSSQSKDHLRHAIDGLSQKLKASLGASSPLGDSLSKGELREEDVAEAFRPHLPSRYELLKGIIVDSSGRESDPQDLVLLDTSTLPSILGSGRNRVVPVEGVVGTIQLKSLATKASIESGIANIASAKRLVPSAIRYGRPASSLEPTIWSTASTFFGGLLCLRADGSIDTLLDHYAKCIMELPVRERCDAFCIVDQVAVVWGNPSEGDGLHFAWRGEQAEAPLALHAKSDSLLFFYTSLVEHINNWISPPIQWMDYVFGTKNVRRLLNLEYTYWKDDNKTAMEDPKSD